MTDPTGHDSGHPSKPSSSDSPGGLTWGDLIASLVEANGTLTQVAWKLVEHADGDDVASVERALRRLRTRGQRDGGRWGQRLVRVFGVPRTIEDRVRWLGLYHSPFTDLPVDLCLDQLRLWDRPPMSSARARVWIHLGFAGCALRMRRMEDAVVHCDRTRAVLRPLGRDYDLARIELALIEAFIASHRAGEVEAALDRAAALLSSAALADGDRACLTARLADQRAYQLNRAGKYGAALALYQALPATDVHPFASYRRDAGFAYGYHRTERVAEAIEMAHRACTHAGDGGYTRLRAMGLILIAKIGGPDAAASYGLLARARAIGARLGDDELIARCDKAAR
jgi:hypothetical protein